MNEKKEILNRYIELVDQINLAYCTADGGFGYRRPSEIERLLENIKKWDEEAERLEDEYQEKYDEDLYELVHGWF